ncbi:unnamed protein product [Diatraea saccharalis]|uniref:Uncharacterized protein n=1 Tax=Diatraea saccharalis TaxID=40085 RepID=A0A9N9R7A8_9NEOP|nr:unnamed protein product [Diatraea saccharalis]
MGDSRYHVASFHSQRARQLFQFPLKTATAAASHQTVRKLHFLSPPSFSVERVVSSNCGSRVCVWGTRGVTVAELPSRWGRGGLFDSGNQTVLCKYHNLTCSLNIT